MRTLCGILAGFMILGSIQATGTDYRIGKNGAVISLGADWQRTVLVSGFCRDQFSSKKDFALLISELETPLKAPADFEASLSEVVSAIKKQDPTMQAATTEFSSTNGIDHSVSTFTCRVNGISLYYEMHLLGRDGLFFMLRSWSSARSKKLLSAEMKRVTDSLKMPEPGTEWGKSAIPTPVTIRLDDSTLKCNVQKSIFITREELPQNGPIFSLMSKDDTVGCHFFQSMETRNIDARAKAILEVIKTDHPDAKEVSRENVTVAGKKCLQLTIEGRNRMSFNTSFICTLVPTDESRHAEIRFITTEELKHKKTFLDALLKTMELSAPKKLDAFPVAGPTKPDKSIPPAQLKLLKASTLVATFEEHQSHVSRLPDGSFLGIAYDQISLAGQGSTNATTLLAPEERSYMRDAVYRDGALWYTGAKGKLMCFKNKKVESTGCDASRVVPAGADSLLLCRARKAPELPGFSPVAGNLLVLREKDGKERTVKETLFQVSSMTVDPAGRRAVYVSEPEWRMRSTAGNEATPSILDLTTGSEQLLPAWKSISGLGSANEGWLIQGQPPGKPSGIYHVAPDGQLQLLLSGIHFTSVALTKDELFYFTAVDPDASGESRSTSRVYRIPLAALKQVGPNVQPFHGELIQKIAAAAFAEAKLDPRAPDILAGRKQFDDFLAIAQKTSRNLAGLELPVDPVAVDDLLGDYGSHHGLRHEGQVLMSVVLAASLLGQKADWIEGPQSPVAIIPGTEPASQNNPFVLACSPGALVASVLSEGEDSWYNPATQVHEMSDGRPVVLCNDPSAYLESQFGEKDRKLRELMQGTNITGLAELLKAQPQNVHLRQLVYDHLIARQPLGLIEKLAANFASTETPLVDLKLMLGVQSEKPDKAACEKLIQSLRSAITRFPAEPAFYVMLGGVYEASGVSDAPEYARLCYKEALRISPYGPGATKVKTALARLDGKADEPLDADFEED
ncbi:MAG: hypothetical protein C0404_12195 [Verrucomicrobia bacterium]|nr:hypothetical protein [Verrucomicrobiota bacterium]